MRKRLLKIYFTSDMHGFFFPTDYIEKTPKAMGLIGIAPQFEKDGNTLIIDGGDTLQGSPFTYYCHLMGIESPAAEMMNSAGYDYVVPGNHDFNYGRDELISYFKNIRAQALAANVTDLDGDAPILPYTVRTLQNGLRVGIVGVVTDWVNRWEKAENLQKWSVTDTLSAAMRAYQAVKPLSDITVCVYHGGIEKDLQTGRVYSDSGENIACRICESVPFTIMLTGHQHIALPRGRWKDTHLVQTPANATHFARVEYFEGGAVESDLYPAALTGRVPPGAEKVEQAVQKWLDEPIGYLNRDLTPRGKLEMAVHGTPIARFFNRVQMEASGCELSSTSLANEIRGFQKRVTVRDVVSTYVYPNTLVVLRITGEQLKRALERCAAYFHMTDTGTLSVSEDFLKPKVSHYNYDFVDGVYYRFEIDRPIGQRVASIRYHGKPVRAKDVFSLCVNNYRATGVGGYDVLLECPRQREILTEMSELILSFFARTPEVAVGARSNFLVRYRGKKIPI